MILRPRHLRAIDLLAGTDFEKRRVAAGVGVTRRTLARWQKDAAFRAELARRRAVQPYEIDGLRMEAARRALLHVIEGMKSGIGRLSMKETTALLDRLVGDDFGRASPAAPPPANEPPSLAAEPRVAPTSPEETEAADGRAEDTDVP